jgi:MFS family permease
MRAYLSRFSEFTPNARAFLAFTAMTSVGWGISMLAFNLYLNSLGYSRAFIGNVNSVSSVGVLILSLPIAFWSNRAGRRPFLIWAGILGACAVAGYVLMPTEPVLIVGAFVWGCASGIGWVVGGPLMVECSTEDHRVYLFSASFAMMMGVAFVGSLIGGFVPEVLARRWGLESTSPEPLRWTLLLISVFYLIGALAASRIKPYKIEVSDEGSLRALRGSLPLVARLVSPHLVLGIGAGAMVQFFQLFFAVRFSLPTGAVGIIIGSSSGVTAFASLVAPRLSERFGRIRTVVGTQTLSLPFLAALAYCPYLWPVLVSYYARAALMNMSEPVFSTFAMERVPADIRAPLSSLYSMVWSGGWAIGASLSGTLQEIGGFPLAFSLTLVCYFISTSSIYAFFGRSGQTGNMTD